MSHYNASYLSSVLPSTGSMCVRVNPAAQRLATVAAPEPVEVTSADVAVLEPSAVEPEVAAAAPASITGGADTVAGFEPGNEQLVESTVEEKPKKTTSRRKKATTTKA